MFAPMMEIPEEKIIVVYQGCNQVFQNETPQAEIKLTIAKYNLPKSY